jgi:hypothetical protein
VEVLDLVISHAYSFGFEQALHFGGAAEVVFAGKQAVAVHDPVRRYAGLPRARRSWPNPPCGRHFSGRGRRHGAVRSDPARRHEPHHVVYILKKPGSIVHAFGADDARCGAVRKAEIKDSRANAALEKTKGLPVLQCRGSPKKDNSNVPSFSSTHATTRFSPAKYEASKHDALNIYPTNACRFFSKKGFSTSLSNSNRP